MVMEMEITTKETLTDPTMVTSMKVTETEMAMEVPTRVTRTESPTET